MWRSPIPNISRNDCADSVSRNPHLRTKSSDLVSFVRHRWGAREAGRRRGGAGRGARLLALKTSWSCDLAASSLLHPPVDTCPVPACASTALAAASVGLRPPRPSPSAPPIAKRSAALQRQNHPSDPATWNRGPLREPAARRGAGSWAPCTAPRDELCSSWGAHSSDAATSSGMIERGGDAVEPSRCAGSEPESSSPPRSLLNTGLPPVACPPQPCSRAQEFASRCGGSTASAHDKTRAGAC